MFHIYPNHDNISNLMIELNNCKSIKDIETRLIYKEDSLKKFEVNIGKSTKLKIKQKSTQLIPEFQNNSHIFLFRVHYGQEFTVQGMSFQEPFIFNTPKKFVTTTNNC